MKLLALDPGNHTGWVSWDTKTDEMRGGTIVEDFDEVFTLCGLIPGRTVIYETFQLYPSVAKSLSWNEFYPCQVIGVIKLAGLRNEIAVVGQAPSVKKYAGGLDERWCKVQGKNITEHTKDAFLHLKFFARTRQISW